MHFVKRILLILMSLIWTALLGVIAPIWLSLCTVLITGTSKGFGVNLGSEGTFYFSVGIIILILGIIIFGINLYWVMRYLRKQREIFSFFPIILFLICSFCVIAFTVGIVEYFSEIAKCFAYGITVYWKGSA